MDKMMEEGGLATDGMEVDPVSGNEIPVGSNASDVRDDVDVKLSEGEYVVPADVVKYIGVSTLEKMVNKAKEGLEDMGENGRIGGAPVASSEDKEDLLEYTLSSDLDTLDGYAAGGLVPGTDINGIIDRVKGAAAKDPSIVNMLKAKGIFIQDAGPQAQPAAVQAMAEGGVVTDGTYRSSFDPREYQMGFSYTGLPLTKQEQTKQEQQATGTTSGVSAPVYQTQANTPVRITEPGEGRGPDENTPTTDNENAGKGWMGGFDYGDPDALAEATMSTMSEDGKSFGSRAVGLAGQVFAGPLGALGVSVAGKAMAGKTYSEAMANSAALAAQGHTAQANAIAEAAKSFAKENNLNTKGLFTSGLANKTAQAIEAISQNSKAPKGSQTTSTSTSTTTAPTSTVSTATCQTGGTACMSGATQSGSRGDGNRGGGGNEAAGVTGPASGASIGGNAPGVSAGPTGASSGAASSAAAGSGHEGNADPAAGGSMLNKGGLVAPRPYKKKKMEKKPTVKKGLGRK